MGYRPLRILVVSHDSSQRQFLGALIDDLGCEAIEATDFGDGMRHAHAARPDIVVIDWEAPGMGGRELAESLRGIADGYRPHLLLMVAGKDKRRLAPLLDCGIDDFIVKPLRRELVSARLRTAQRLVGLQRTQHSVDTQLRQYCEELSRLQHRVRELTVQDELTGLPNRRHAMERLERAWAISHRAASPLACLVVLLSGLKPINQRYGHERGDIILKTVAAVLKSSVRAEDEVCRIDGNEFLVICRGSGLDAVLGFGSRLHSALRETLGTPLERAFLGLHVGAAEVRPDVTSAQALINLASHSARQARRHGSDLPHSAQLGIPQGERKARAKAVAPSRRRPGSRQAPGPGISLVAA